MCVCGVVLCGVCMCMFACECACIHGQPGHVDRRHPAVFTLCMLADEWVWGAERGQWEVGGGISGKGSARTSCCDACSRLHSPPPSLAGPPVLGQSSCLWASGCTWSQTA